MGRTQTLRAYESYCARKGAQPENRACGPLVRRKSPESDYFRLIVLDSCEPGLQGAPHCLHSRWSTSHCGGLSGGYFRFDPMTCLENSVSEREPTHLRLGRRADLTIS